MARFRYFVFSQVVTFLISRRRFSKKYLYHEYICIHAVVKYTERSLCVSIRFLIGFLNNYCLPQKSDRVLKIPNVISYCFEVAQGAGPIKVVGYVPRGAKSAYLILAKMVLQDGS